MFKLSLRVIPKKIVWLTRELSVFEGRCVLFKYIFKQENSSFFILSKNSNMLVSANTRYYAKSRDIKKEKRKQIKFDENELQKYFDIEKLLEDFKKPVETFKAELVKHATLRTSANAIESIKINFEGNTYTIQDLAQVGKKNPGLFVLDFSTFPGAIPTVITTLQNSELNLNVHQDGSKIFVPLPKVTKEHREVLAKKCKLYFQKCKESIRAVQIMHEKSLNKIEKLPAEDKFRVTDQLIALGDKQILFAEEILKEKHKELLSQNEIL